MLARFSRLSYLASTALALSIAGNQANANPTIQNPDFLNITGSPKETFSNAAPVGWSGGTNLVFIASSSTSSSNASSPCGSTYLQTYGCPSALIISGGYNVVESDGNPTYNSSFYQTLTGLTVGENYSLSFYQAASQQSGFSGATTNQWIVGLGKTGTYLEAVKNSGGSNTSNCGPVNCYQSTDTSAKGASIAASTLMSVPSGGLQNWEYVSVLMKAKSTNETLSFLAWGDNGNSSNLPPIAFMTGLSVTPAPEPASLAVFGVGLAGLGGIARRRRAKRANTN